MALPAVSKARVKAVNRHRGKWRGILREIPPGGRARECDSLLVSLPKPLCDRSLFALWMRKHRLREVR